MLDVLIIGAGPSGLFAAEQLSAKGLCVRICDKMASPARKFLMAGRGGLNLTHSEDLSAFMGRYREATGFLAPLIEAFPPNELRRWCDGHGGETFTGTSGRVFPKAMKASPLLRAWLRRLEAQGVSMTLRAEFAGLDEKGKALIAENGKPAEAVPARAVLLALGGGSWPKLGSNAGWVPHLEECGIHISPFEPANCGFEVAWSDHLTSRFSGFPLKRIRLSLGEDTVFGEAIVSDRGLEGGAVYAISASIRQHIKEHGQTDILLDLRPEQTHDSLAAKLAKPRGKQSMATFLKKTLKLLPVEQALLREPGPLPATPEDLAARIKALKISCKKPYPIDRAISSAGGIALNEVDDRLMLKKVPGVFAAGEMLDWEAPTGGYLLQACFATAFRAAAGIEDYLKQTKDKAYAS
ncbi:TIGR03862 family flavoprotein [Roseibium denhamense]|uniref:TIGR03862 family flavoprotein n=1 Tax=Roseibium denhamense TaxID=76305 RepID=A0ABY1P1K0_9HYPH|nr:TIGR03862 family flavoprotein [Roseibium denhamense]MTI07562.1 TIGR03862 family flavoprotein [Roseibium denhamense]SMP23870.1 hypothetical protein SAMN06265374_2324 [Roseibium denhamense]